MISHPVIIHPCNANSGDIVWACRYERKNGKVYNTPPIRGMLMYSPNEGLNQKTTRKNVNYFIPFNKKGTELVYSKAVRVYSRTYAKTEEECALAYINKIKQYENQLLLELNEIQTTLYDVNEAYKDILSYEIV